MTVKRPDNQEPHARRRLRPALQWTGAMAMLVAIFIFASHAAAANRSFTIAPPPSWVEQVALPAGDADDAATKAAYLLLDHQIRVSGGARA